MSRVVVVTGPTATGKTALGVSLAELIGGEVVGADSMQIYRRMDIGTAKPTAEEMRGVAHHMIDIADPEEDYSASRYADEAAKCVEDILARGKMPIIVGGTGLYIDALLRGTDFAPPGGGTELRAELSAKYDALGGDKLLCELSEHDPETAGRLHPNDKKRIVRALEVFLSTGKTMAQYNRESQSVPPRYEAVRIALNFEDRAELYSRIDRRVDIMMERGLKDEVRALLESGVPRSGTAMQAIGYKELIAAMDGLCSEAEAVEAVKRESRRYAKRQLSWLGRFPDTHWILRREDGNFESAIQDSTGFLKNIGIM